MFTDFDQAANYQRYQRARARNRNMLWCLYPHSARPVLMWDGIYKPKSEVAISFVVNQYHKEILRDAGYTGEMANTGWHLSEIKQFCPRDKINTVVFAPIHPNNNGWLSDLDKELNWKTHDILASMSKKAGFRLIVRHIKLIEQSGIEAKEGVEYIQSLPDGNMREALLADVVVSHQTYAYVAVALGIPTVMMGEKTPARCGNSNETFVLVKNWQKYMDKVIYPLDILDCKDPFSALEKAAAGSHEVEDWKRRLIGTPFSPNEFFSLVKMLIEK
jgi:hypothetical protein